jgi:hypothetical protein
MPQQKRFHWALIMVVLTKFHAVSDGKHSFALPHHPSVSEILSDACLCCDFAVMSALLGNIRLSEHTAAPHCLGKLESVIDLSRAEHSGSFHQVTFLYCSDESLYYCSGELIRLLFSALKFYVESRIYLLVYSTLIPQFYVGRFEPL